MPRIKLEQGVRRMEGIRGGGVSQRKAGKTEGGG
jgi:hypothetical protein